MHRAVGERERSPRAIVVTQKGRHPACMRSSACRSPRDGRSAIAARSSSRSATSPDGPRSTARIPSRGCRGRRVRRHAIAARELVHPEDARRDIGVRVRELNANAGTTAVLTSARCVASGTSLQSTAHPCPIAKFRACRYSSRYEASSTSSVHAPAGRRSTKHSTSPSPRATIPAGRSSRDREAMWPMRRFTSASVTETALSASGRRTR